MQLNKYLASCGVTSRRKANHAILEGRVELNGERVKRLGVTVDPWRDVVRLDGKILELSRRRRYVLLHKPAGVITSAVDGRGRKTVIDLVGADERLFPVGRLDLDTEGVLLLTDDGDLAYRLTHPKFEMEKVYEAVVEGCVDDDSVKRLARGVSIGPDVRVKADVRLMKVESDQSRIEIRIHEGKKRQIKRMMKAVGHPVMYLKRRVFAGLTVDDLEKGAWRDLDDDEVNRLYEMTGLERHSP